MTLSHSPPRQQSPEARIAAGLASTGTRHLYGVPDTGLSGLFAALAKLNLPAVVTPNEGVAVACAAGAYVVGGGRGAVLLQNSGLGVCVNPILSLVALHRIPLLLLVGLRGDAATKDEPQHRIQGQATRPLLDACGVGWTEFDAQSAFEAEIAGAWALAESHGAARALLLPRDLLGRDPAPPAPSAMPLDRDDVVEIVVAAAGVDDRLVASTGLIARSVNVHIESGRLQASQAFLNVGAMGYASSLAVGMARTLALGRVLCLDGDGALLMHLGSSAMVGDLAPQGLVHIVLNNGCQESVGGFRTSAPSLDYPAMARAFGYAAAITARTHQELVAALATCDASSGPTLIDARIGLSRSAPPPRPSEPVA